MELESEPGEIIQWEGMARFLATAGKVWLVKRREATGLQRQVPAREADMPERHPR